MKGLRRSLVRSSPQSSIEECRHSFLRMECYVYHNPQPTVSEFGNPLNEVPCPIAMIFDPIRDLYRPFYPFASYPTLLQHIIEVDRVSHIEPSHHHIHQFPRHDDDLPDRLSLHEPLHVFIGERRLFDLLPGRIGDHGDLAAQLALDLDHQGDLVPLQGLGVGLGPGGVHEGFGVSQFPPQDSSDVRDDGGEKKHDGFESFLEQRSFRCFVGWGFRIPAFPPAGQFVDEFHDGGDGGIEGVAPSDVVAHLDDGLVDASPEILFGVVCCRPRRWVPTTLGARYARPQAPTVFHMTGHQPPQATQEAEGALDGAVGPFQGLVGGGGEHGEEAHGVGAVFFDELFGIDGVALGFGHLGAVFQYHTLGEEIGEGFVGGDESGVPQ